MNNEINEALMGVFRYLVPELILGSAACILFVGATFRADRHLWAAFSLITLLGAGVAAWYSPHSELTAGTIYAGPIYVDALACFIKALALAGGVVLVLMSWDEVPDRQAAEYYACLMIIIAGVCLTGAANELITLFLSLEVVSIPTYVLLYMPRHDNPAQEAALKYFLLSIFSSALLLFGLSYVYGLSGTTNLPATLEALLAANPPNQTGLSAGLPAAAQLALIMIVAGLGFRITAVPFHFYAPDVYQGAPTVAAALLAFVPKVAGFAALLRVLGFVLVGRALSGLALGVDVAMLFYILAIVTMALGNFLALLQDNIKRLLAYSSVAHAGYMLIGLAVAPQLQHLGTVTGVHRPSIPGGVDAVLFYLVAYGGMTIGAFAVLSYLSTPQRPIEHVDDLAGLARSHPGISLIMGLFLLSLIGIPLTAGFAGKWFLFFGAVAVPGTEDHPRLFKILALVAALNAAIGAWYYLRVLAVIYLRTPIKPLDKGRSIPGLAALWICALVTLVFGIAPETLSQATQEAAHPLPPIPEQRADR
ncbi:MAG TPA: NADH-quinone oxidoreductase subunit N [Gemmataceae bacterium]|nr:NADH-quinone oxidoreductase subunit N [Gemmataceae bacterium]